MPKLNFFIDTDSQDINKSVELLKVELGLRDKRQVKALRFLLCNFHSAKGRYILVSRRRQSIQSKELNPQEIKYGSLINCLDKLIGFGYVELIEKGDYSKKKMTTVTSSEKLNNWFKEHNWSNDKIRIKNPLYVTLREPKDSREDKPQYIDYKDTAYSLWLKDELKKYSDLLNHSEITEVDENEDLVKSFNHLTMQRRFIQRHPEKYQNTEFLYSGRMPGAWCNMSSEDRANRLRINGNKVVEVDREASHINAMYEVVTGMPYQDGYPYDLSINSIDILKHIVKNAASIMQSTYNVEDTARIVGRNYSEKANKKNAKEKHIKAYQEYLDFMSANKGLTLSTIINAFLDKHPKVREHYLRGKPYGDLIRGWESDIVFETVIKLTEMGIPTLTVYDSFIVEEQYEATVKELIKNTRYIDRRSLSKDTAKSLGMFSLVDIS